MLLGNALLNCFILAFRLSACQLDATLPAHPQALVLHFVAFQHPYLRLSGMIANLMAIISCPIFLGVVSPHLPVGNRAHTKGVMQPHAS